MISSHVRLSATHIERLLTRPSAQSEDPLSRVLAAASAPGRPDELAGEEAAVRAFHLARRAARPAPSVPEPAPHRRRARWGWALLVKVAAVVLATVTASWALAATTGVLPAPWQDPPERPPTASHPGQGNSHGPTRTTDTASSTVDPSAAPGEPTGSTSPTAAQNLRGRCQSFVNQGKDPDLLDSPNFARLVAAAGGKENVPSFCEALLAQPPSVTPTPSPTPTAS